MPSPHIPVLVGIGQHSERIEDPGYEALSPAAIGARAAAAALADAGVAPDTVDVLACTRQFDESFPGMSAALGRPDNFPRAVANRIEADPARYVYAITGGQSPQQLVTELAGEIAAGTTRVALVVAAEAISTVLHLSGLPDKPDFTEITGTIGEDRGVGLVGMMSADQAIHQVISPATQYALFENARRIRRGQSRAEQALENGRWFAPFTEVAAANPHAAVRTASTAEELTAVTGDNRLIVDPYPKSLVAREKVNQSAAVLMMSEATAAELGVPAEQWVYLRGHSDLRDRELTLRPELDRSRPSVTAVHAALAMAGVTLDDVATFDLYSCFPIAVSVVAEDLGLTPDDPRGLTVTGGLPFFGGPGNGYSLHAIVETVDRCRRTPGSVGLVGANGGMLSKYSVGVYTTAPGPWRSGHDATLQAELDAVPSIAVAHRPHGWATLETWTVRFEGGAPLAVVVGRLADGRRFVANDLPADDEVLALLLGEDAPGARLFVRAFADGNRVALTEDRMDELAPVPARVLRPSYETLDVVAEDGVLEITIRSDEHNTLTSATNAELAGVFDAFDADPALRVAILTGTGVTAFATEAPTLPAYALLEAFPETGIAGLTARTPSKPVIAAVNGSAIGAAFEVVLACQLVVAADHAEFGLPQVRGGLLPAAGGIERLGRALPPVVANRLVLTGRPIGAPEAERHGLVNAVVSADAVLKTARELAAEIVAGAPLAISLGLGVLDLARGGGDATEATRQAREKLLVSTDAAEAFGAAAEQRTPYWRGN
jgi:acetyl-CoA C-acetyltransferase